MSERDEGLEELETVEELESEESQGSEEPYAGGEPPQAINDLVSSYAIVPIPIAVVDSGLAYQYRNDAFRALLSSFGGAREPTVFGSIGRFLDHVQARDLYAALKDPRRGHSWSGTVRLKAKNASSVIAKMTVTPFIRQGSIDSEPDIWVLMLDDVTEEQTGFLRGLFSSLLEASKLKDNDTGRHIERVNLYAEILAKELYNRGDWPEVDVDFVDNIGFLAAMHDVGKIGTPDDILNKKGPLDEFEWNIMKEHTINGAFILSSYPNPMAKQIAQSHHEWWNGSGYPYNLVGDMIPLPARIVALADVYDALRMRRSYKEPFDHERASLLIMADGGTHFDPALIEVFKSVDRRFEGIYDANADADEERA